MARDRLFHRVDAPENASDEPSVRRRVWTLLVWLGIGSDWLRATPWRSDLEVLPIGAQSCLLHMYRLVRLTP